MKTISFILSLLALANSNFAQGTFQNLNFELADVPLVPNGQFGEGVPVSSALPFWEVQINDTVVSSVLHNNLTLGSPAVSLLGPEWERDSILEGRYTPLLISGAFATSSLIQAGLIPADASSIRFRAEGGTFSLQLQISGFDLTLHNLGHNPDAKSQLYAADVSAYKDQIKQLRFTATANPQGHLSAWLIDDIQFSPLAVPEPNAVKLLMIFLLLYVGCFQKRVGIN